MMVDYRKAVEMQRNGMSLTEIKDAMGLDMTYEAFQKGLWRYKNSAKSSLEATESEEIAAKVYDMTSTETTKQEVLERLKKGITLEDIGGSKRVVLAHIEDLKDEGYCIEEIDGVYQLQTQTAVEHNETREDWNGETEIQFGLISDTHICSNYQQITFLNEVYDEYERRGIKTVYHVGDLLDGQYKNRDQQIYEIFKHGADEQVDYFVENFPRREGIKTKVIIGNHDNTFIINAGVNIGRMIAARRDDIEYLGHSFAKVWLTPKCDMDLVHPIDGSAYALSYSLQKYCDAINGGEKPKILAMGHHHKFLYMFYRNIHSLEVPTTQAQTPFMRGKKLCAYTGALICKCKVDKDGTIKKFDLELIPLYKARKKDY